MIKKGNRSRSIDLIKFVACIMVVILHAFEAGGIQEWIYLLGTFGIPLFFLTNGFLLGDKNLSPNYFLKKIFRYLLFMVEWSLLLTLPYLIIKKEFMFFPLLKSTIIGDGQLYHLWFLTGLITIYLMLIIINLLLKPLGKDMKEVFSRKSCIIACFILSLLVFFLGNLLIKSYMNTEIRNVIPAAFRIIDNGIYFVIGMYLKLNLTIDNNFSEGDYTSNNRIQIFYNRLCNNSSIKISFFITILLCYIIINVVSKITEIIWVSSFYTFPIVIFAVILLFMLLITIDSNKISDIAYYVLETSTGVWILHPFVLKVIKKICIMLMGNINLLESIMIMTVTILVCVIVTMVINKIKYVNMLFKP